MEQVLLQETERPIIPAQEKKQTKHSSERKPGLDALRAIAILLVVWYHSFGILKPLFTIPVIGQVFKKMYVASTWIGPLGVDLFFVLSGFLIGSILIKIFLKEEQFTFKTIVNFWMRRWLRTVPNYYFMLVVCFLLYSYLYNTEFNWKYFLFIQNLTSAHPPFFGEAWSLAVEEWFYLTVPVALMIVNYLAKGSSKNRILLYTFSAYLILFISLRFIKSLTGNDINLDTDIRKVVVFRLDAIMYGVIVALAFHNARTFLLKWKKPLAVIGLIGSFLAVAVVFMIFEKTNWYSDSSVVKLLINSSFYTVMPIFFAMLLPHAVFVKKIKYRLLRDAVMHISLISYSMYLIHYSLIYIPFFEKYETSSISMSILLYVTYWVLVFIVSAINYRFIEAPVMKLRNRISPEKAH
ncbi:O-acetyltransferase OatA [Dyadobacter sp. CECT 9623]|uniref:O-acetyltransferase OatA n=1 Tax=Dyadobacter linearis TaxID=2823330 RepID=A0ABM8UM53_9BACT|nr:acyltransferase [Dyadobacter sp. CECT 9623]CAG5068541.1 O-acetyltransferase OatA [Dyadobacter sp. CECT 9623]